MPWRRLSARFAGLRPTISHWLFSKGRRSRTSALSHVLCKRRELRLIVRFLQLERLHSQQSVSGRQPNRHSDLITVEEMSRVARGEGDKWCVEGIAAFRLGETIWRIAAGQDEQPDMARAVML